MFQKYRHWRNTPTITEMLNTDVYHEETCWDDTFIETFIANMRTIDSSSSSVCDSSRAGYFLLALR